MITQEKLDLKIYAKTEVIDLEEQPELYDLLDLDDYKFRPERIFLLHIEAYDWNCPQHITPRYTVDDIETALIPQQKYIAELEQQLKDLKAK